MYLCSAGSRCGSELKQVPRSEPSIWCRHTSLNDGFKFQRRDDAALRTSPLEHGTVEYLPQRDDYERTPVELAKGWIVLVGIRDISSPAAFAQRDAASGAADRVARR